jgi:Na+/melibiose symporter-like transporter
MLVRKLREFRTMIVALGVAWIVLAAIGIALGVFLLTASGNRELDPRPLTVISAIVLVIGVVWLVLGVGACAKQIWSVYTGLVLCYVSALGNLFSFNVCAIVIMLVLILQAHRVIGLAGELKRAGIPLTMRPGDLQVNFVPPA